MPARVARLTLICAYKPCQQPFEVLPSRRDQVKYCSDPCRWAGYAALRGQQIAVTCANPACQKAFTVPPNRLKRGNAAIYCSDSCKAIVGNSHRYPGTFVEKFWAQIAIGGPDECWPWQGRTRRAGYGAMHVPGKPGTVGAHVISWYLAHGRWPLPQHVIAHVCDVKLCTNPAHLWEGTQGDNIRDAAKKGRLRHGETHPAHKLTDAEWVTIVTLLNTGTYSWKRVAVQFGVSAGTIQDRLATMKRHESY